jgi:N-acetyl-gamma-glutamyl-phosphate reductase
VSFVADVLVAGASGFAGALAARLVDRHPSLTLGPVTSRSHAGTSLLDLYPHHRVGAVLEELDLGRHADVDAAIVAYPHGAAAPVVAGLRERGVKVVDLSADFRLLDRGVYESWYVPHGAPELIGGAAYGLTELNRERITGADLVANPGCFPTGALLALAPLARAGLIADVVIDAKTGVSGAGRAPTDVTHFVSVAENVKPYKAGSHRHTPEIDQELAALGAPVSVTFVPHLVPVDQGELMSCYVTPSEPVDEARVATLFEQAYAGERFIELVDAPPGMRDVRETNRCHVSVHVDPGNGRVMVFAAIDNLWKGTSSQAIQNLNLMLGLPEDEGLEA